MAADYLAGFDDASVDAFRRQRVSFPFPEYAHTNQYASLDSLIWETTTASGGTNTHTPNTCSMTMAVTSTVGSKVTRQTHQYIPYQPAKSHNPVITFVFGAAVAGVRNRAGYFDSRNGIYLERAADGGLNIVKRTYISGSPVETRVAQADWNVDRLNGTGRSLRTLDLTKVQIFYIDAQFLGAGLIRVGFVIDGNVVYVHAFAHANIITSAYMTTFSLPMRVEIENVSAAAGASMQQICSAVDSEGGSNNQYVSFSYPMLTSRSVTDTALPLVSIKVADLLPHTGGVVNRAVYRPGAFDIYTEDSAIAWWWVLNGTLTNPSFAAFNASRSGIMVDVAATAITGGTQVGPSGYATATAQNKSNMIREFRDRLSLCQNEAGNSGDILSLVCKRLTATSSDTWASVGWDEVY